MKLNKEKLKSVPKAKNLEIISNFPLLAYGQWQSVYVELRFFPR